MREPVFLQLQTPPYQAHEPHAPADPQRPRNAGQHAEEANGLEAKSHPWREAMKILVSALVALSVLSAVAAPVSAAEFDSKKFWQEQGNRY
jgi:hypothetical protein